MSKSLRPVLAGAGAASLIVAAGDAAPEACVLATISGILFGKLAHRAQREQALSGDGTDLGVSLAFLAVLVGAGVDLGRGTLHSSHGWIGDAFGLAVIALAILLRRSALASLGSSYSVRLGVTPEQPFVESGPYRWVRHPNYSALLAVALGTAFSLSSPLAAIATLVIWLPVTMVRIAREERMLAAHFGERYERYQRRSWRLVPGIY